MKLFDKIKNILFDDEEEELSVVEEETVEEEKEETKPQKTIFEKVDFEKEKEIEPQPARTEFVDDFEVPKKRTPKIEETIEIPERDLSKVQNTFNFPMEVDERDFIPEELPKKNPNALELEQRKVEIEKHVIKKTETVVVRDKPFKASPIISPVYGVMDKNYKKEDIVVKQKIEVISESQQKKMDLDKARKKAFGTLEDEIETTLEKPFTDFYKEIDPIIDEVPTKSVDDLLIDAMDEKEEEIESQNKVEESSLNETFKLDEVIEEMKKTAAKLESEEDDLFNLIDSMYENESDGEK